MGGVQSSNESRVTDAEKYVCAEKKVYDDYKAYYEHCEGRWVIANETIYTSSDAQALAMDFARDQLTESRESKLMAYAEYMRVVGHAEVMFNVKYDNRKPGFIDEE